MLTLDKLDEGLGEVESDGGIKFAKVQFVIAPFNLRFGKRGGSTFYGALPGAEWRATPENVKDGQYVHVKDVDYMEQMIPINDYGFEKTEFVKSGKNNKCIMVISSTSQDGDDYTYYNAITMELEQARVPSFDADGKKVINEKTGKQKWEPVVDEAGNKVMLSGWEDGEKGIYPALKKMFSREELHEILEKPFADFAQSGKEVFLAFKKVDQNVDERIAFHYLPLVNYPNIEAMKIAKEAHYSGGDVIDVENSNIVFPSFDSGWSKEEWAAKGIEMVKELNEQGKSNQEIATALKVDLAAVQDVFAADVPAALTEDELPF